jgi:hypothetical protein
MFPAVALASRAGTAAATAAADRDAADIDPAAVHFQAAACARVERAAVADRPAWVWLPDSGTPDVEASADAVMALPVARPEHHSPQRPVAAAHQTLAAQRGALDVERPAVPASSEAAASASSDAVPQCADESWAARRDQVRQVSPAPVPARVLPPLERAAPALQQQVLRQAAAVAVAVQPPRERPQLRRPVPAQAAALRQAAAVALLRRRVPVRPLPQPAPVAVARQASPF